MRELRFLKPEKRQTLHFFSVDTQRIVVIGEQLSRACDDADVRELRQYFFHGINQGIVGQGEIVHQ